MRISPINSPVPGALRVGETGTCTLVSRNAGSASCTGFVFNGMIGYDDSGSANLVRFSGPSSSQLPVCFDSGSFPEVPDFTISFAYCFSDFGELPPGGTIATTANVQLLAEPPSGVIEVAGFAGAFDETSEFGDESEASIVTIVAGATGCNTPRAPAAYVPSSATQQQPYELRWLPLPGVSSFDVEESNNPDFSNASRSRVLGTSAPFVHGAGLSTTVCEESPTVTRASAPFRQQCGPSSLPCRLQPADCLICRSRSEASCQSHSRSSFARPNRLPRRARSSFHYHIQ